MSQVNLRFATDILRRLGEELNQTPDQGILELVKNSYDADARICTIELISTHEPGGTIRVSDDGDGMKQTDIENGWLVLGRSSKTIHHPTRLGRLPVGNKGLGRLAALRMGHIASLLTKPRDEPARQYAIEIHWREFDEAEIVDDVVLEVHPKHRSPQDDPPGTTITIADLHVPLKRTEVRNLARGLVLLADPFGDNPLGFQPILKVPEFDDLERLVQKRYFDDAEFHLVAHVDEHGIADACVMDWKGNELYRAHHAELRPKSPNKPYECPVAKFDMWVFLIRGETFKTHRVSMREVQEWLKEFGGVHLYLHGLRVSPYGDPGNDWLDLNLRRVQNPELRPGTNSSIGRIAVTDLEERLRPKTDRSGLIEGEAFKELKRFSSDALEWMAKRRLEEREGKRAKQRTEAPRKVELARKSVDEVIESVPLPVASREQLKEALGFLNQASDNEVQTLHKDIQLYRTLSTVGITQAVFVHESKHPVQLIQKSTQTVKQRACKYAREVYETKLHEPIERILRQVYALQSFGNVTSSLLAREKRRSSRVDIHDVIDDVLKMFGPLLDDRQVRPISKLMPGNPYLRGSRAALESIITNLLVNSLKAFEAQQSERIIEIHTSADHNVLTLRVMDNGPGIQDIILKEIWLPGQTTYDDGTGLGLTIVRDTVHDLGGEVEAIAKSKLGGAEVVIRLPIIGV